VALVATLSAVGASAADWPTSDTGLALLGVNISGAGFAPHVTPGKNGTNYFYPEKKHFKYYADQGIRLIRFPFIWERVQHSLDDGLNFDQIRLLKKTLDLAAMNGQKVILDSSARARCLTTPTHRCGANWPSASRVTAACSATTS
jgi:endoglucanase